MRKGILYLLLLFSLYSFSQEIKENDIIGTWELINTLNQSEINIGQLTVYGDEKEKSAYDSIHKVIEKREKEDHRKTKWHYVIGKEVLYEYRLEFGSKFRSRIINNFIYKFDKPFYEIISLKEDTLKLREHKSDVVRILKKVNVNLDDFKILSEH